MNPIQPAAATAAGARTMKAATYRRFGGPDVVRVEEIAQPAPRAGEVLIKVMASTVSVADHRVRSRNVPKGLVVLTALTLGLFRPRVRVLGMDVAGVVESVGSGVTAFQPGDEVIAMLGAGFGGHAEYVSVPANGPIATKPRNMGFEEAVTLLFGGLTAKTFLGLAAIKTGSTVLINGASGAVGTAAIQLAKHLGAHVTAVSSGANRELMESLGADGFIDYTTADFTADGTTYDVVMDCVGNAPFARADRVIAPGGALLLIIADLKGMLGARGQSRRSGKLVTFGGLKLTHTADDVAYLVRLAEDGKYRAVIDRTYHLADVVEAHRFVDTGRKRGNVVLRVHEL
jgi:NADPH:quinone reductase-like Zn-dependent oxidoreductase